MKEKRHGKRIVVIGAIVIIAVCFVAGYALGSREAKFDANGIVADLHQNTEMPRSSTETAPAMNGAAPSLADLLPGLEAKVAANPRDLDQRVLLAQTYDEVGQREKSIQTLRAIHKDAPDNSRAIILLATSLADSSAPTDLREAFGLLDEATRRKPEVEVMARLYQGEIRAKLGDVQGARRIWRQELARLPAGDSRRQMYEDKLAQPGR